MLSKACDTCHLRKAKCSGTHPCARCSRLKQCCTYLSAPKKKGPRAGKSRSVSQCPTSLDNPQVNSASTSSMPGEIWQIPDITDTTSYLDDAVQSFNLIADAQASVFAQPPLMVPEIKRTYHDKAGFLNIIAPILVPEVENYLSNIYPLVPVVDPTKIRDRIADNQHYVDRQLASLLLAMCANSLIVRYTAESDIMRADDIMEQAVRLHASCSYGSPTPTLETIATCMLIGGYLRAKGKDVAAYIKTREAIAFAELMDLHRPSQYDKFQPGERELAMRIFWKLAVADRSNSLIQYRPMSFRTPAMPLESVLQSPLSSLSVRLKSITRMFDAIEADVADCINGLCSRQGCKLDQQKAIDIYQQLLDAAILTDLSPVQVVDVTITQIWLLSRLWQGCVSHALLEQIPLHPILQINYPLSLMRQVLDAIDLHPLTAFEGNGRCVSVKLGEIADTIELVVSLLHRSDSSFNSVNIEHTSQLATLRSMAAKLAECKWIRCESP